MPTVLAAIGQLNYVGVGGVGVTLFYYSSGRVIPHPVIKFSATLYMEQWIVETW